MSEFNVMPWLWLVLLAGLLWLFQKAKVFAWGFVALVLPGTLCHELCHWLVAKLLNGRPASFSLLPKRQGTSLVLGSVRIAHPRWYNVFFIGVAPLVLLWGAHWIFMRLQFRSVSLVGLGLIFLVANLAYGAVPSSQDLRMAAKSPVGWVLLGAGLVWGWMRVKASF